MLGGALMVASPFLPWMAGVEYVPGHPSAFYLNGFSRFVHRYAWGRGWSLLVLGFVCLVGGLLSVRGRPLAGAAAGALGGLAAAVLGILDSGFLALMSFGAVGFGSYEVRLAFAPGLPALFAGSALSIIGAFITVVARPSPSLDPAPTSPAAGTD